MAGASGLTVRTQHHWEALGLVVASERTAAGHRRYTRDDVARLYVVVALRGIGLPLAEIQAALDGQADVAGVVVRHRDAVARQRDDLDRLLATLSRVLAGLTTASPPSAADLFNAILETRMIEQYYTPDQLAALEERRLELGQEGMERAQRDWAELIAAVEAERAAGTGPAHPRMQQLAARWRRLIEAFTGGDPDIAASLQRMYAEQGPAEASHGAASRELMEYVGAALAAARG